MTLSRSHRWRLRFMRPRFALYNKHLRAASLSSRLRAKKLDNKFARDVDLGRAWKGKDFDHDWTSADLPLWHDALDRERNSIREIVEIGAFQGRSTCFFAEYFTEASITSIDPFRPYGDLPNLTEWSSVEERFDHNTQDYRDRITKRRGTSLEHLTAMLAEGDERVDLVYVDGSHFADDVYIDSVLSWRLLRPGGYIIWDDYTWRYYRRAKAHPKFAVDLFLDVHSGEFDVIFARRQVCVRKRPARQAPKLAEPAGPDDAELLSVE